MAAPNPTQLADLTTPGFPKEITGAPGYLQHADGSVTDSSGRALSPQEVSGVVAAGRHTTSSSSNSSVNQTISDPAALQAQKDIAALQESGANSRNATTEAGANLRAGNSDALTGAKNSFDAALQARQQVISSVDEANRNIIALASAAEQARQAGLTRDAQSYQNQMNGALSQYHDALSLVPQLGQLSTNEATQLHSILTGTGDILARAQIHAGGSATNPVYSADELNNFITANNQVRQMISDSFGTANSALTAAYNRQPMQDTGFQAPQLMSQTGAPPTYTAPTPQAAPTVAATPAAGLPAQAAQQAPSASGGTSGGGFTSPTVVATPTSGSSTFNGYGSDSGGFEDWGDAPNVDATPVQQASAQTPATGGSNASQPSASNYAGVGNALLDAGRGFLNGINSLANHADGGFTRDPAFLGNEKGAELFINPTHAPIAIVDAKTTKTMGLPGHADGTLDATAGIQGNVSQGDFNAKLATANAQPTTTTSTYGNGWSSTPGQSGPTPGYIQQATSNYAPAVSNAGFGQSLVQQGAQVPTLPSVTMTPQKTQQQMIDENPGTNNTNAILNGQPIHGFNAYTSTVDPSQSMRTVTSRQLASLNPDEQTILGQQGLVGFNNPLSSMQAQASQQYNGSAPLNPLYSRWFGGFAGTRGLGGL